MLAMERARYILDKLKKDKVVLVTELSKEMNVSEETIRKDLDKLEKEKRICRVHGGAYLREGYGNEISVDVRARLYREEKAQLGRQCLKLIEKNDTIILDCSTTDQYIARAILEAGLKITVITNSLDTAYELSKSPEIRVLMLGGELDRNTASFHGQAVLDALERYHADKVFLSSAGLSLKAGMTDYRQGEADVRRKMMAQSDMCCFVADMTKIERHAAFIVGGLSDIQYLIVERKLDDDPKLQAALKEKGVIVMPGAEKRGGFGMGTGDERRKEEGQ